MICSKISLQLDFESGTAGTMRYQLRVSDLEPNVVVISDKFNLPPGLCLIINVKDERLMIPCEWLPEQLIQKAKNLNSLILESIRYPQTQRMIIEQPHKLPVVVDHNGRCTIHENQNDNGHRICDRGCQRPTAKVAFVRRNNKCHLLYGGRYFTAFPAFCDTRGEIAAFDGRCKLRFYGNFARNTVMNRQCKHAWDRNNEIELDPKALIFCTGVFDRSELPGCGQFTAVSLHKKIIINCFYEGFYAWLRPTKKGFTSLLENAPMGQKKEEYTCLQARKRRGL
uniref:Uncharacterized protein n=1 Tax=Romanomermis culicivorax TaxID=13658 RepID=A0A915IF93_ROMCU